MTALRSSDVTRMNLSVCAQRGPGQQGKPADKRTEKTKGNAMGFGVRRLTRGRSTLAEAWRQLTDLACAPRVMKGEGGWPINYNCNSRGQFGFAFKPQWLTGRAIYYEQLGSSDECHAEGGVGGLGLSDPGAFRERERDLVWVMKEGKGFSIVTCSGSLLSEGSSTWVTEAIHD